MAGDVVDRPGDVAAHTGGPGRWGERSGPATAGLPVAPAPRNHGKTSAAWITIWLVIAGSVLCTFGAIFESTLLIVGGGAVVVGGLVVGRVMRAMGLGQRGPMAAPPPTSTSRPVS